MNKERIIRLLEEQLGFAREQTFELLEQNRKQSEQLSEQSAQIARMSAQIDSLTQTIQSLEEALKSKDVSLKKAENTKKALGRMMKTESEKIPPRIAEKKPPKPTAAERGNNNARRKEYLDLEVEEHDIYPAPADIDMNNAVWIKKVDSIRYKYIPPRIIKCIYHIHHYAHQGKVVSSKAPASPFLNSNFDASIIAGMLQMRYIYSLPIERIIKFFAENGFALKKPTAHGLIAKAADLLGYLEGVLKQAVLEDEYIHMDETYYTVLEPSPKNPEGKASSKVYIWSALAHSLNLIHFFYDNGSRARKVLTAYLPQDYKGMVQSDGYTVYKILETDDYMDVYRLPCLQHCKRKFLDIGNNKHAKEVVDIMNELYQTEHQKPPGLSPGEILAYRNEHIPAVLKKLKKRLEKIRDRKDTLPKSNLGKAVGYALGEYPALLNYLRHPDCELDNNAIERNNRYISLSRKNSLFCATHQGVKNATLIYSLACSCRLHNINTFEYFEDILNKLANVNPNTKPQELRQLLPDKWKK